MGLWGPLCRVVRDPTARRWRPNTALQARGRERRGASRYCRRLEFDAGRPGKWKRPAAPGVQRGVSGDQADINESNGNSLSVTLALASTNSVTLFSETMASTSAMRERSDRYQRCTSIGFS